MPLRKRFQNRVLKPVSGFLLALFVLQSFQFLPLENWSLPFTNVAAAASDLIDPNGDGGVNNGTAVGCGGAGNFDCIDDGAREPNPPAVTGSDYVESGRDVVERYALTSIAGVATATDVTVWIYHRETNTNFSFDVRLLDASETVQYGTVQNLGHSSVSTWSSVTFSGVNLSQTELDGLILETACVRNGGGNAECQNYATYAEVTYEPQVDVTLFSTGSQQNLDAGTTSAPVGGAFALTETTASRDVNSITLTESGSIDASNDLSNIKLYYEFDETAPYDCVGQTYDGTETQYGSTVTGGFSAADGSATFSDTGVGITTTRALCLYPVLDVSAESGVGDTIELAIADPSNDVTFSSAAVLEPTTAVALAGTTTVLKPVLTMENYHWRNDDGSETSATSVTGGTQNQPYATSPKEETKRLRIGVGNLGNTTADPAQFRLEFAEKTTACSAVSGWTDVGAAADDFDMSPTANLTDGANTTDILESTGGVTSANGTFLTTNGGVRDTTSETGALTLTDTEYVELEYALIASSSIAEGTSYCFRVTDAGSPLQYEQYAEATIAADVNVTALGSQVTPVTIPATGQYAGGTFRVLDNATPGSSITSVTVSASGTIDLQNDISDIRLRYDVDTTSPYTCDDVSYANTDAQFGATVTNFSSGNQAVFTDSLPHSPTETACFYVEYTVSDTVSDGESLDVFIANPANDVVVTGATVAPNAAVNINDTTTFAAPFVEQTNYHWRNDDGLEADATSATDGVENTPIEEVAKNSHYRLRIGVENTGGISSDPQQFQLEWTQKAASCAVSTGWERVDTASDAFAMAPTANLTDGESTTDIAIVDGGVSETGTSFFTNNGGVKDENDTVAALTVLDDTYLDVEYSITPTTDAVQGGTYCFRVTNNGAVVDAYDQYPELTVKLDTDFKIQHGTFTMTGTSTRLVAGTDYDAPVSSSSAFIRITNTQLTGAGPNTGNGNNNADDVTVYILDPENIESSVTFARSLFPGANTRVAWEIIEYTGAPGGENEIRVRRQESISYLSGNTTVSGTASTNVVDDTQVAVFITGQYNQDTGRNNYPAGLSTAAWNTGTNQVDLTRGASGVVSDVSYALVEFTGSNWNVQRVEHTYTNSGVTETETMDIVNSLSKTFMHVQKRTGQNNHADFGHAVYFTGISEIAFLIDPAASVPSDHTSVAWVIENTQTLGTVMDVTPSNGTFSAAGAGPESNSIPIGKTLSDLTVASLFVNNYSDETQRSWPEPILSAQITSESTYELWRSDTSANIAFRTLVVEWPTAFRKLDQNYYRIYENTDDVTPLTPWPAETGSLGENAEMTGVDNPMTLGDIARIRMTLHVNGSAMPAQLDAFKLQYAERDGETVTTCSSATSWVDVGEVGSTTAPWRGAANPTPTDGTALSTDPPEPGDLLISISDVAGTYEEENNTETNPYSVFPGEDVEYDWVVQHNGAKDKTSYCFRMVEEDGTQLESINFYPVLRTVGFEPNMQTWRWYDDEENETPTVPLAAENVAPIDVVNQNVIKLRTTIEERSGAAGVDNKFVVQYSEYADFSQAVATATPISTCSEDSLWCYADGAGVNNERIDAAVLSDADACTAGVGDGCGTYNENISTSNATYDHPAYATSEYEFTLRHAGARANAVYYFRLYDVTTGELVELGATSSYPSLVTEGPQIVFSVGEVESGTTIGDIVTDATSTATTIDFGLVPLNSDFEIAQEVGVNSNSTDGYQVFLYADQPLTNGSGETIQPISATNASPASWATACPSTAVSCFGYHSTDATLEGGDGRFSPVDSYAALTTSMEEVLYSSVPTVDANQIVYRMRISETQPPGDYEMSLTYIIVPAY